MHMQRNRIATFLAALLLLAGVAVAQDTGAIAGRVLDAEGAGVGAVTVAIVELPERSTTTDGAGRFSFDAVPAGSYSLSLSLGEAFASTQSGVTVAAGATANVDAAVDWQINYADTITVFSASRRQERIVDAPAAVTVVPLEEISREASSGQVPKLLEYSPGVDFTQSGLYDFNFNTRGFNSSLNRRILTLIDGRDPAVPFLGSQEWAALSFPVDEIEGMELVRGPGSALYGANAFAGVLNLTTKAPRGNEGAQFRLTAGDPSTFRGDFRYAGTLGPDWYFKVVGGAQTSDDYTRSRNTAVEYSRFCTTAGQTNCLRREARPLARERAKIGFGGLRFDRAFGDSAALTVEAGTASLSGPTFLTGIGRVQVTDVNRPWGRVNFNTLHWNLSSSYDTRVAENQVAMASGALLFEDSSNLNGEVQGNVAFASGKGFLVGGLGYKGTKVDTSNKAGFGTLMAEAKDEHSEAAFGQVEYNVTDRLKAVVAGRVDESTLHDTQFSPKGSLVFAAAPNHTFRVTYNEAFQVPNYSEFFLRVPAGAPITAFAPLENALAPFLGGQSLGLRNIPISALGNSNLTVEEVTSYEVGYNGIFGTQVFLTVDYYQSKIENFVTDLLPGVNPAFPAYAPPGFLPAPIQAQILATLRGGLGPNFAGLTSINGQPTLVLSYANAGAVDTQGVDVAVNYYITNRWVAEANYSWFDFDVQSQRVGDLLLPNGPENKYVAGLSYNGAKFSGSLKYRNVEGFPWAAGVFVGDVPGYEVVDLGLGYRINSNWQVGLDVSNLADDEHFESFGGDLLSRRTLASVAVSW